LLQCLRGALGAGAQGERRQARQGVECGVSRKIGRRVEPWGRGEVDVSLHGVG